MRTEYVIAEVEERSSEAYEPRGAVKQLWSSREREIVVSGPSETGKTWGCCQYLDALLWKYPGAQGGLGRKVRSALNGAALQTFKRVLGPNTPVKAYGGEKPEWFQYPNGSRLWVFGLDDPGKALSSERDFIYINQCEECTLTDWETLTTRVTGRGAVMPNPFILGDANPGPPDHWILHRPGLKLLESRHEDNPTLYDEEGKLTEQGERTMSILDALTGVRYERLRKGKWVKAEGVVYEEWDRAKHMKPRKAIPASWPSYWLIDFGYTNPFVWECWREDNDGRLWLQYELYLTQKLVQDAESIILGKMVDEPRPAAIITDHDAEDRQTWEQHNVYCVDCGRALTSAESVMHQEHKTVRFNLVTQPASKSVSPGLQKVQDRLRVAGDGLPRLLVMEDALIHEPDESLALVRRPTCSWQEVDVYAWPKGQDGKPVKEVPVKENDHGMDLWRYLCAYKDPARREVTIYDE
ncbi:MAG: terminase [Actinomycetota bacterium]|nr:terminase [Actinomycetota bacterium]